MSDAAWGLSFGKFLELSFSNHAAASRVASCGHSLHRDCLRFYGYVFSAENHVRGKEKKECHLMIRVNHVSTHETDFMFCFVLGWWDFETSVIRMFDVFYL